MCNDLKNDEPPGDQDAASESAPDLAELVAAMTAHSFPDELNWGIPAGKEIW
jgi:antitoxin component of MazEF toxin-antitoxin module